MGKLSWQYIAGFFDGEGNICVCPAYGKNKRGSVFQASMAQSGEEGIEVLTAIQAFLKSEGVTSHIQTQIRTNPKHRDIHALQMVGKRNLSLFLMRVYPYLHVKRVKAQDTLRYLIIYPDFHGRAAAVFNREHKRKNLDVDVDAVLEDAKSGMPRENLFKKHGISSAAFYRILEGVHWKQRDSRVA